MKRAAVVLWVMVLALPMSVFAEDSAQFKKVIQKQSQQIAMLMKRIEKLETKTTAYKQHSGNKDGIASLPDSAKWVERIKIKGDLRYRHELIESEKSSDRNRHRIRARIGLDARVTNTVDVSLQIATGSDDPVSSNQTLDGGFSSKSINLDLAYFDWHPESVKGLHILGGKMKNPFHRPGKTELIFDGDLRPEGGAIKYSKTFDNLKLFSNLGAFWVEERSGDSDTGLFGVQLGAKYSFPFLGDKGYVLAGASYYDYGNTKGEEPIFDDTDSFGNSTTGAGNYNYDYDVIEGFAELGFKIKNIPISIFGDYVINTSDDVNEERAWLAGIRIGKCKAPRSWAFRYNYRDIEPDAVLGVFTDSDLAGGGTDASGHEIGFDYQIAKNWKTSVSYFHNDRDITTNKRDYDRLQLDLIFKF